MTSDQCASQAKIGMVAGKILQKFWFFFFFAKVGKRVANKGQKFKKTSKILQNFYKFLQIFNNFYKFSIIFTNFQ